MNQDSLIRVADAMVSVLLWLMAGTGVVIATATGQWLGLVVAMALVLEGYLMAVRVLRA